MTSKFDAIQTSDVPASPRQTRILVAIDKSDAAQWALEVGAKMAQEMSAKMLLVNVVVPAVGVAGEFTTALAELDTLHRDEGEELLKNLRLTLPSSVESHQMVREGLPADEIVAAAKVVEADFIVMGTRTRGHVAQFLLGSTAEAVIRRASCPVVTVGHRAEWATPRQRIGKQEPEAAARH